MDHLIEVKDVLISNIHTEKRGEAYLFISEISLLFIYHINLLWYIVPD